VTFEDMHLETRTQKSPPSQLWQGGFCQGRECAQLFYQSMPAANCVWSRNVLTQKCLLIIATQHYSWFWNLSFPCIRHCILQQTWLACCFSPLLTCMVSGETPVSFLQRGSLQISQAIIAGSSLYLVPEQQFPSIITRSVRREEN